MNRPTPAATDNRMRADIQYNCDISDARDHGIYSMCSLVLKLRNLFKWERGLEPWVEPEPAELLDWIDAKERHWEELSDREFRAISLGGQTCAPDDVDRVNGAAAAHGCFYGAGHGRALKSIFFFGRVRDRFSVAGCPVILLGREYAREMEGPVALVQDGQVVVRSEVLRFFLYDHLQELSGSCRSSVRFFMHSHGLLKEGLIDRARLAAALDRIADRERDLFVYHEVGELLETGLGPAVLHGLTGRFPGTVIEFVGRAVKDVLADTHPRGALAHIIERRRESTLGLYVSLVDGLRQELFPELAGAWKSWLENRDWRELERARCECRSRTLALAETISGIAGSGEGLADQSVLKLFNDRVLTRLGLAIPNL